MSKQCSANDAAMNSPAPSNDEAFRPKNLSLDVHSFDTNVTSPLSHYSSRSLSTPGQNSRNSYGELTIESVSAEVLVYPEQVVTKLNEETEVYVGIPEDEIDREFVEDKVQCAILLMVERENSATREMSTAGGQAGIVLCRDGLARFVTAKHNLMSKQLEDETTQTLESYSTSFRQQGGRSFRTNFGDLNCSPPEVGVVLRGEHLWEKGVDVSWGQAIAHQVLGETFFDIISRNVGKFEMVAAEFQYEARQKVGFAIFNPFKVSGSNCQRAGDHQDVPEEKLEELFGPAGSVTIYTGEISYVGDHHIEYSINSLKGCSGAIVFLLNCGQPESLNRSHYGKAIAVHAGFKADLGTNLGFKFTDPLEHNNE
jgi:hypothetical protein